MKRVILAYAITIATAGAAAEAMPESEYSFRATPQVRTFAEIIGHIADSQNFFCGVAAGSNPEYSDAIEQSAGTTSRADRRAQGVGREMRRGLCEDRCHERTGARAVWQG